jgi:hypothetical protein
LSELAESVAHFAADLNERQEVAVNAFDGNDEVAPFLAFGAGKEQFRKLAESLGKFRPRSRNSNLYGAVYQGISALEEKLNTTAVSEKQATLIVFTDRSDLSHTVGLDQMKEKLKSTPVQVYIIGVGEQINRQELTMLGRTGTYLSNDPRAFKKGFADINQKLVSLADGRYVISYCSTKRKGTSHKLEIKVDTPNGEAKVTHKFSAVGFRNGCSPQTKPVFEEIEAIKADAAEKQKEIDAKENEKAEAEAQAALAAIKAPEGKGKDGGKAASKDNAKAGAKEAAKTGPAAATGTKAAAAQTSKEVAKPAPPAKEPAQVDLPPAQAEESKASAKAAKQATDNE